MRARSLAFALVFAAAPRPLPACTQEHPHEKVRVVVLHADGVEAIAWRVYPFDAASGPDRRSGLAEQRHCPPASACLFEVPEGLIDSAALSHDVANRFHDLEPLRAMGGFHPPPRNVDPGEPARLEGARSLADWIRENHLPDPPRDATANGRYLAVRMDWLDCDVDVDLAPLAVAFRSPKVVLPVRWPVADRIEGILISSAIPMIPSGAPIRIIRVSHPRPIDLLFEVRPGSAAAVIARADTELPIAREIAAAFPTLPELARLGSGPVSVVRFEIPAGVPADRGLASFELGAPVPADAMPHEIPAIDRLAPTTAAPPPPPTTRTAPVCGCGCATSIFAIGIVGAASRTPGSRGPRRGALGASARGGRARRGRA